MNFFELFGLPLSFDMDTSALTREYYKLSRAHHPDNFVLSDSDAQENSETNISQINEGYKILKDHQLRIRHILEIYKAAPVEGQDKMPQEFLMEMMELNEAIMSYRLEEKIELKHEAEEKISAFEADIDNQLKEIANDFNYASPQSEQLQLIKDCYLKSKYLRRLKDNLNSRDVEI